MQTGHTRCPSSDADMDVELYQKICHAEAHLTTVVGSSHLIQVPVLGPAAPSITQMFLIEVTVVPSKGFADIADESRGQLKILFFHLRRHWCCAALSDTYCLLHPVTLVIGTLFLYFTSFRAAAMAS